MQAAKISLLNLKVGIASRFKCRFALTNRLLSSFNSMPVASVSQSSNYCTTPNGFPNPRANMDHNQPLDRFRRDHVDNLRKKLEVISSKTPQEQDITLEKDEQTKLAKICVRSGAKNALSGSDLVSVRATANSEAGLEIAQIMQYNLMRLQQLPMISVAFIEGYALGGGAELAIGADLRLMSTSARIGFVHINMGVCCGWGGGSRLVQLLGPSRALDLLASGRLVDANEAQQLGLSNGTIEPPNIRLNGGAKADDGLTMAMDYLRSHTVGAKETYAALKTMLNSARTLPLADSLKVEAQLFASTWGKEPHIRALNGNLKHNSP